MRSGWQVPLAVVAVAIACLTGCSAGGAPHPTDSASVPSPQTSVSASPVPVEGTVSVDEAQNGMTISVRAGDRVVATLHSTYWQFAAPSGVLRQQGDAVTTPDPKGSCLPGVGCGTVRLTVVAASAGDGTISAGRSSCGEAMGCPPGQGSWSVRVVVR